MTSAKLFDDDILSEHQGSHWRKYSQDKHGIFGVKAANKVREQVQLSLLEARDQECLRCGKVFISYQKDIHMCSNCRNMEE